MADPIAELLEASKCYRCFSGLSQTVAQTYLLAVLNGGSTDPNDLAEEAKSFLGLSQQQLGQVIVYLTCLEGPGPCTPEALETAGACYACASQPALIAAQTYLLATAAGITDIDDIFQGAADFRGLSTHVLFAIQAYLHASLAGVSDSVNEIAAAAKCLCFSEQRREAIETYLLTVGASCTDNPATLIPIITGHYNEFRNLVSIDILFPRVCCEAAGYGIYAAGTDTNLQAGLIPAEESGAANYEILGVDVTGIGSSSGFVVKQGCAGGFVSDPSNIVSECTDEDITPAPVLTAHYTLGYLDTVDAHLPDVYCSAGAINFYSSANADMSGATLIDAVAIPGLSGGTSNYNANGIDGTAWVGTYIAAKQLSGTGTLSAYSNVITLVQAGWNPEANDWALRVVANGGAMPSNNSIIACSTFIGALKAASIWTKFKTINMVAPDNLIAARTPLVVGTGLDPWTNVGSSSFVSADLTLFGLHCNGAKALNTGVNGATAFSLADSGLTIIASVINPNNGLRYDMGYLSATDSSYMALAAAQTGGGSTGHASIGSFSTGGISNTGVLTSGYISMNRTSATACELYYANADIAHASIGSTSNNQTSGLRAVSLYVGAVHDSLGGAIPYYSKNTISYAAAHEGLTVTESLAHFNAAYALRTSFGGGTGDIGDGYVGAWTERIIAAGGTIASQASRDAVHDFIDDLWLGGVLTKIYAAIPLVDDSLIAATSLIIWNGEGNETWTNHNFVGGDLTVNGLLGAATKYLDTGFVPSLGGLVDGSAGLIAYIHTNNATGVQTEIGCYGGAFNSFFGLLTDYNAGTLEAAAWRYSGNDNINGTTPASITGYYSFHRTTTSRADVYFARSNVAHSSIANSVGAISGSVETTRQLFAFGANNNGGGVTGETLKRMSFVAITPGLSSADDAIVYAAVQAFRTALGGGFV